MLIRHRDRAGGVREADLFGTFAALARDEVDDFPALRPHQRHPWHAFLAQVGALALLRAGTAEPPDDAAGWRALLLALTPGEPDGEAWDLVVDDWSKPALLQPPGMEAGMRRAGRRAPTPDALDMLVTARNHDLKAERIGRAEDDDWLFALVSLQTQEGQMGAGNYGASRMNGGYGSRVGLGLRPAEDRPGTALRRDLRRLLALRPRVEKDAAFLGDLALLWLEPWDGGASLSLARLDPWYVEVCRRVRLVRERGAIQAVVANSKGPRVAAQALKGVTGDPWAPVEADGSKAWGVSARGFGYRQMTRLLDAGQVRLPLLADPVAEDGAAGLTLLAQAVARGQGKTEGFHERRVAIPPKAASQWSRVRDRVAAVAKARQEAAGTAADILRHALRTLAQGGPERARLDDAETNRRIERFERLFEAEVDRAFFDAGFWGHVLDESPVEDAEARWLGAWWKALREMAAGALAAAEGALPRSDLRRLRAVSRARAVLFGRLKRYVEPDAGPVPREDADAR